MSKYIYVQISIYICANILFVLTDLIHLCRFSTGSLFTTLSFPIYLQISAYNIEQNNTRLKYNIEVLNFFSVESSKPTRNI